MTEIFCKHLWSLMMNETAKECKRCRVFWSPGSEKLEEMHPGQWYASQEEPEVAIAYTEEKK